MERAGAAVSGAVEASPADTKPPRPGGGLRLVIVVFGVVLPLITVAYELAQRMCAEIFFDPLPTVGHILVVLTVPGANVLTLRALARADGDRLDAFIFGQSVAVAVAAMYTLIFLPLTPVAVMAIIIFGLGFLALAPMLALVASFAGLRALRRLRVALGRPRRQLVLPGLAAGLGVLVALQIPTTVTRVLMAVAASDDPATSRSGLRWLRRVGQRELLLRACYQRPSGATDLVGAMVNLVAPVPPEQMREIYYRVTGRPFDGEPRPRLGRSRQLEEDEWDATQGGTEVGVVPVRGLSLASSRLDGSVDGRAAVAYLEWTIELRNGAPIGREARAEVALPPGGVVSRVTLWVNGVEREATFAGRDVTRRAYESVVRARRDPILVTSTAPDRVLVQCFPVPPNGGVIKARIGITAPLHLPDSTRGILKLPHFTQRNFDVPASVSHLVSVASKDQFATPPPALTRQALASGGQEVRGRLAEPRQSVPLPSLTVMRPAGATVAWTADRSAGDAAGAGSAVPAAIIRQELRAEAIASPPRLVVVIDGSQAMGPARAAITAALEAVPGKLPVAVLVAGDETHDLLGGVVPFSAAAKKTVAGRLEEIRAFDGGTDSLPALVAAWDRAAEVPGGIVLWIHGPQPALLASAEELRQRVQRRAAGPSIHTYAATGGENRLLANLADLPGLLPVPRAGEGTADLEVFLRGLAGGQQRTVAIRIREPAAPPPRGRARAQAAPAGEQTSDHLARLWARDRIDQLVRGEPAAAGSTARPSAADREEALALAARYNLVTAVSGAVVLETRAQYDAAGLTPASSQVPTVPEPETWALLLLVLAAVLLATLARHRRLGRPSGHAG